MEQEGAGHQVLSAFVEIVFDNSDNRIPVNPYQYVGLNQRSKKHKLVLRWFPQMRQGVRLKLV